MKRVPQKNPTPQLLAVERRIDDLCSAFEQAWKGGEREPIEQWLPRVPQADQAQLLFELIRVEVELRKNAGETLCVEEYQRRFSELIDVVSAAFRHTGQLSDGPSFESTAIAIADSVTTGSGFEDQNTEPLPVAIGRYSILGVLGTGAFGRVYLASDPRLNRQVAIKVAKAACFQTSAVRELFLRDARSAAQLDHPGIVRVFDVGDSDAGIYIVQQYIDGRDLEQHLRSGRWPLEHIVRQMSAVADALAYAHKRGLVHCDLKPANILIDGDGKPYIADFGLAVDQTSQRQQRGVRSGTPRYMSPEQVRGEIHHLDGRADIWSLGVILYELATGCRPFDGETVDELFDEILNRNPRPPRMIDDRIPEGLERIILKCLAKPVTERYTTAREVARDLQNLERRPLRWQLIAVVAVVLIIAAVAWRPSAPEIKHDEQSSASSPVATAPPPNVPTAPLQVEGIDVQHFAHTPAGDEPRGLLGQKTFSPVLGDRVQVRARLSRPAYAYLIAFRPDGMTELCYPDSEDTVPTLTDSPAYPQSGQPTAYGLREGTGLWVFAVVASETPLPVYRDWLIQRMHGGYGWKPMTDIPAGIVWWDDGRGQIDTYTPAGRVESVRGKNEPLEGPARMITELMASVRKEGDVDTASAIGFCVVPQE